MRSGGNSHKYTMLHAAALALLLMTADATAAGSRQLVTGGASTLEGGAGGGLVPWSAITGYGAREEIGATAFATHLDTGDYRLDAQGVALGLYDRVELSAARQELDLVALGPALGLPGAHLRQHVIGAKVRLAGDVLYTAWPQISLGVQYKKSQDFALAQRLGARDGSGVDVYLAATKVFLAGIGGYNAFLNATARWTDANETGLLGFGGTRGDGRQLRLEASGGLLLSRHWAVGAEYRDKSGHLEDMRESAWRDVFVGWFPNRHVTVVLAYVDLGTVASLRGQTGWYLSAQGTW